MNAQGLYADAIHDYNYKVDKNNNECVDESVVRKFERTFTKYSLSQYASRAHFYLGLYYTQAYFILAEQQQELNLKVCVGKSNEVLQQFLDLSGSKYKSRTEHVLDAYYFRALNFVLLNQMDHAIKELKLIEGNMSKEEKIYVYRFYYSSPPVVDKYFNARELASQTVNYLIKNMNTDFQKEENLRSFVDFLSQPKKRKESKGD